MTDIDTQDAGRHHVLSRRAVGRAAVWSVPVIAGVAMAPAAAASGVASPLVISLSAVCTSALLQVGGNGFTLSVTSGTLPTGTAFVITSNRSNLRQNDIATSAFYAKANNKGGGVTVVPNSGTGSTAFTVAETPSSDVTTTYTITLVTPIPGSVPLSGITSVSYTVKGILGVTGLVVVGQTCS